VQGLAYNNRKSVKEMGSSSEPPHMKQARDPFGIPAIGLDRHGLKRPFICLVSISTTSIPASVSPRCNHCDMGPAFKPMAAMVPSMSPIQRINASGSLSPCASLSIFPCSLTTQIVVFSNGTSSPPHGFILLRRR